MNCKISELGYNYWINTDSIWKYAEEKCLLHIICIFGLQLHLEYLVSLMRDWKFISIYKFCIRVGRSQLTIWNYVKKLLTLLTVPYRHLGSIFYVLIIFIHVHRNLKENMKNRGFCLLLVKRHW